MKTLEPKRSVPIGFTIVDLPRNRQQRHGRNAFLVASRRRKTTIIVDILLL
jgi:hypothetical protein